MIRLIPLLLIGCITDDWDGTPYDPEAVVTSDTGTVASTDHPLMGAWNSVGDDISSMFSADPFNYVALVAQFESDGSYTAISTDSTGTQYVLAGDYVFDDSSVPGSITLWQTEPFEATAEGIWQIDTEILTYEVVQTVPDYGFAPPTPDAGFGSTSGPGIDPGTNTQVYRR